MLALTYHGSKDVRVDRHPDPILQEPDDIILRVTATAICGSDLHLYRGKIPRTEAGDIFGHEFMGIVEDAGPAVTRVAKGDRVVIPFVIACGGCFFVRSTFMLPAKRRTRAEAPSSIKNKFRQARRYLGTAICMAEFQADKRNMFAYQKLM